MTTINRLKERAVYTHILISTDGSELSQRGIDHGLSLAKRLGSKVTIITATEPFPITAMAGHGGWVTGPEDLRRYSVGQKQFADELLSIAKTAAEKARLDVNTLHIPDAWPASAIVDVAQKLGCDLIVMASHGRRGLKKILLGSQTSEVLVTSTVPVLVVR